MTRLQKVAVWNIGVMVTSMLGVMILVLLFPKNPIGMGAMSLMFGLFFGNKIFKGKNEPDWDEMEKQTGKNATIHGYTVFWIVLIMTTSLFPIFKGYRYSLPIIYVGFIPLFAAYLLIITISLSILYQSSLNNRFKKLFLLLAFIVILFIPAVLTGKILSTFSEKSYFTGSTQKDEWHFNSSKNIIAHSKIIFKNCPEGKKKIYVSLPYINGKIQKVLFAGQELKLEYSGLGEYYLYLPNNDDSLRGKEIKVIWQFPFKNLEYTKYNNFHAYRTKVRSLIPVDRIWLTGILDEGCGYEVIGYPKKKKVKKVLAVWSLGSGYATTSFGSCGFAIRKTANTEIKK